MALKIYIKRANVALDIANLVADLLGHRRIKGIARKSRTIFTQAIVCNYHPCRRDILCQKDWKFAHKSATLVRKEEERDIRVPDDCLRILSINGEKMTGKMSAKIHGRYLSTKENEVQMEYTSDFEAVWDMPECFKELFVYQLAKKIAPLIIGVGYKYETFMKDYNEVVERVNKESKDYVN